MSESKPKWAEIPERYRWLAQDANGEWWGYKTKPAVNAPIGAWVYGDVLSGEILATGPKCASWRGTLELRPPAVPAVPVDGGVVTFEAMPRRASFWYGGVYFLKNMVIVPDELKIGTKYKFTSSLPEPEPEPEPELKPCPFCGGDVIISKLFSSDWSIHCDGMCGAVHRFNGWTRKQLIDSWNRRAE